MKIAIIKVLKLYCRFSVLQSGGATVLNVFFLLVR